MGGIRAPVASPPSLAAAAILRCLLLVISSSLVSSNSEGDALWAQRQKLNDPKNDMSSWDPTLKNPCTWFHVTCDGSSNVTRVDLGNAFSGGTLDPALGQLPALRYLVLYGNGLNGEIPKELGNLKNLIELDLYDNKLTGSIPEELCNLQNLRFLRLNDNILSGTIPRCLLSININIGQMLVITSVTIMSLLGR